ncbi:hypothetical protein GGR58DRAFT_513208 [Xylaria digitata]|nr:hypothetical protein GGR58DRAFT_513208 [Xylaria digitata]
MEKTAPTRLRQIRVGAARRGSESHNVKEYERFRANLLLKCPAHLWPKGSYRAVCPHPILITEDHWRQAMELSEALTTAITDIVDRWWSDPQARFFERMPLKREEEDLLRWLEDQVSRGRLKKYFACPGSWRPDFLIEDRARSQNELAGENFLITEINGRFPFNGAVHIAYAQEALEDMNLGSFNPASTTAPAQIFDGLRSLFNPSVPLHLLIGEEAGMDIHMLIDGAKERLGIVPRLINPSDLRLEPDLRGNGGYRLCCLSQKNGDVRMSPSPRTFINSAGETVEEIQQVGLELHQHELFGLPRDMLRQLSLCCFNDLRTILLVHDKRMLGIVKQELQELVRAQVLTPDQARVLDEGIVDTFIPDSPQLRSLLETSIYSLTLKDEYVLKPIRSGKGLQSEAACLENMYVVQRKVKHSLYDLVLHASGEKLHYPLVGTWHIMDGRFCGFGAWRSSAGRICAISSGGSIVCSVSENH